MEEWVMGCIFQDPILAWIFGIAVCNFVIHEIKERNYDKNLI